MTQKKVNKRKAVFMDRDGTIIVDIPYLGDPSRIELLPGAKEAIQRMLDLDYAIFLLTNQSGVGRGYYTLDQAKACNARMVDLLDNPFLEQCIATEKPDEKPIYRKPEPRFILEMIAKYSLNPQQCWMVGDRIIDVETGVRANIPAAWLKTGQPIMPEDIRYSQEHRIPFFEDLRDFSNSLT